MVRISNPIRGYSYYTLFIENLSVLRSLCAFKIGWAFFYAYFIRNLNLNICQNFKKFVFWKAWANFDLKHSVSGTNRRPLLQRISSDRSYRSMKQMVISMKDVNRNRVRNHWFSNNFQFDFKLNKLKYQ